MADYIFSLIWCYLSYYLSLQYLELEPLVGTDGITGSELPKSQQDVSSPLSECKCSRFLLTFLQC
jgi:hypothetical protein